MSVRSKLSPVRFLLLIASLAMPATAGTLSVAPGGIERWPGDEVERCGARIDPMLLLAPPEQIPTLP